MAANIGQDGKKYTSHSFVSFMNYKDSVHKPSIERISEISQIPYTNLEDITDIDNPDKHEWYQIGTSKFGRSMFCHKTGIRRSQTMGEFYQNSTVD